jgi:ribose 5-phosphate isomerase RpiB
MRIAVVSEVSARARNIHILSALKELGHDVLNAGMADEDGGVELTYIHTGFMAAALLNWGAADFVVGGCGTGQGFLNSAMQYPNVFCGLIQEPLDAFLFSRINAGNCVSLALNKGYGWAGELNLRYIFEKLFSGRPGEGYPPKRSASQADSRRVLMRVSQAAHRPFDEIVAGLDGDIVQTALSHGLFRSLAEAYAPGVLRIEEGGK